MVSRRSRRGSDSGDAFGIRQVAQKYTDIAYVAANAASVVRGMRASHSAEAWVGDAGSVFRSETDRMPGELSKADDSYSLVAAALGVWASALEDAQSQADRGLAQARDAHADLQSAQSAYDDARGSWSTAHAQQLSQQKLQKKYQDVPPPDGVSMPTDAQLRATSRNMSQSQSSMDAASAQVASANARLEAAKRLVMEAKAARDDAEKAAVTSITDAKGAAVKPSSVWEAIQDSAAWQAVVEIATVVLTIVSIVAIFVGGPLVWALVLAATALLVINALLTIAQGGNAWGDLLMLAIGLIPGGKVIALLGTAAHVAGALTAVAAVARVGERLLPAVTRAGAAISRVADGVRSATGALQAVVRPITQAGLGSGRGAMAVRVAMHAVSGGKFTDEGNIIVKHWSAIEHGPLSGGSDAVADTFRSSTYNQVVVTHDTMLNRTVTDTLNANGDYVQQAGGGFWSHHESGGTLSSQLGFALKPEWNMTNPGDLHALHKALPQATHNVQVTIPHGSTIFEGPAGEQISTGLGRIDGGRVSNIFPGRLPGGEQQVYLTGALRSTLKDQLDNAVRTPILP
ncbi:putative T7SS-secreted protein [Pseudolysinimonas kribbensis]|uniref:putative T7SS-secreted protein n=1 Tax=Pseudolysinimonas kribbensis TaxID=433641 RepID=UPI0032AFF998